jgi:hypothetical protein
MLELFQLLLVINLITKFPSIMDCELEITFKKTKKATKENNQS